MLLAWGQQYVTSSFTGVSMAAVALIVLPMAHFILLGERLTLRRIFGFAIGFAGVLVLIGVALSQWRALLSLFGRTGA